MEKPNLRALCFPGSGCRAAFQFGVARALEMRGERFDLVAGASSGSICGAVWVAGLASRGPDMFRSLASTPVVSRRYLPTERSVFGMGLVVRRALRDFVPEQAITESETELLVSTTHAKKFFFQALRRVGDQLWSRDAGRTSPQPFDHRSRFLGCAKSDGALVIHSNRERKNFHEIIVASSSIPPLYAELSRLDGAVHFDGGASDNTLLSVLLDRGARDITVVTPFPSGYVSPTLFEKERKIRLPPGTRLTLISPERALRIGHFDFNPIRLEEALSCPSQITEIRSE